MPFPKKDVPFGTRIGVIFKADEETVWMHGYGKFLGEIPVYIPTISINNKKSTVITKSKAVLTDSGNIIYLEDGSQWGPEEDTKEWIGDRNVKNISDLILEDENNEL